MEKDESTFVIKRDVFDRLNILEKSVCLLMQEKGTAIIEGLNDRIC